MFAAWGRFVYRHRWLVLGASLLMLPASIVLGSYGGQYAANVPSRHMESWQAANLMQKQLPSTPQEVMVIFGSRRLSVGDPRFRAAMITALAPLELDSRVSAIDGAFGTWSPAASRTSAFNAKMVSRDRHYALASIYLKGSWGSLLSAYPGIAGEIHSRTLSILRAGDLQGATDSNNTVQKDLSRALSISIPAMLVLLLLVFGSLVAAGLPLGVGILAVAGASTATLILARFTDVLPQSSEVVIMIGLGVAVDYSLFIVSRFREELHAGTVAAALERTISTAGRAVVFSGCTVAIGLLGLNFYHFGGIGSVGIAGTFAVALAVIFALTFLCAFLALLGSRVNTLRLPFTRPGRLPVTGQGMWHRLSEWVMARPWTVLLPTLAIVLVMASPLLHIKLGWQDFTGLPRSSQERQAQTLLANDFAGGRTNQITTVVQFGKGSPLTRAHVGQLYDLTHWLATLPHVAMVQGITPGAFALSRNAYQREIAYPRGGVSQAERSSIRRNVGPHIAVLAAFTPAKSASPAATDIVHRIRLHHPYIGGRVMVTGATASDVDGVDELKAETPLALGFIIVATYIVLFLLLGSVLLPLKAVLMNLISIGAAYGALIWAFQDGYMAGLLGFTPNPIDISLPIILFCYLFGLSMDYEVILLSRFKENYERTGDNRMAVATGLETTGRLVTGAALIMASVFLAYTTSNLLYIKEFGVGMGVAVLVDAAIVRTLIVPATMRLLGDWNWWAPAQLARLHARLGLGELAGADSSGRSVAA
jgi:RND superfamily putative drug exporter